MRGALELCSGGRPLFLRPEQAILLRVHPFPAFSSEDELKLARDQKPISIVVAIWYAAAKAPSDGVLVFSRDYLRHLVVYGMHDGTLA